MCLGGGRPGVGFCNMFIAVVIRQVYERGRLPGGALGIYGGAEGTGGVGVLSLG